MATKVRTIYDSIIRTLLEPSGLELGLITQDNILSQIGIVIQDFIEKGGLTKSIAVQQSKLNQGSYTTPNQISNAMNFFYDEYALYEDNAFQVTNANYDWATEVPGNPDKYFEDEQRPKRFTITPKPTRTGPQFATFQGNPFFGTMGSYTDGTELALTPPSSGYGILSRIDSSCFVTTLGDGYGTLAGLCLSRENIMQIGTVQPIFQVLSLDQVITEIPDSFLKYIRYGVLQRIFENDAELKDTMRAQYCAKRYSEGIALASAVNREIVGQQ